MAVQQTLARCCDISARIPQVSYQMTYIFGEGETFVHSHLDFFFFFNFLNKSSVH